MLNFKDYILSEAIYVKDNEVIITGQSHRSPSDDEEISTYLNVQPKRTGGKATGGLDVYSVFSYKPNTHISDILKTLKGEAGAPYTVKPDALKRLIKQGADATIKWLHQHNIEIIIYPKSSSKFLKSFVDIIKSDSSIRVIDDAVLKKEAQNSEKDIDKFIDSVIDWNNKDFSKLGSKDIENLKRDIHKGIKDNIANGKPVTLNLKSLLKRRTGFVTNFMQLADNEELLELMGKKVAIIDDIISSGATFKEISRVLKDMEPTEIVGFTFFKSG